MTTDNPGTPSQMPPVAVGRRRWLLAGLVALGILQALLAVLSALQIKALLDPDVATNVWDGLSVVSFVVGIGLARWVERVVAEDLGQAYVFEQRRDLLAAAIADDQHSGSLGVTITRASNDLSAVRNWIALGIATLVTGIPLILVVVGGLFFIDLFVGAVVAAHLVVVAVAMPVMARWTLARAREVRRRRGRMSARIADTVVAGESVRASGAVRRELNALDRTSRKVVWANVERAWITGATRALTATIASAATVSVVILASLDRVDAASVASIMMLLGVITVPISDLGRVVEYRQNYRAATRILAPLLTRAAELRCAEQEKQRRFSSAGLRNWGEGFFSARGLVVDDELLPPITARPGQVVRLSSSDPHRLRATVAAFSAQQPEGTLAVGGIDLSSAPFLARREYFGLASTQVPLERGSVARLASLRAPDATSEEVQELIDELGLTETVTSHPKGLGRVLKNDGQPWSTSEVMQLKLARAFLRAPAVILIEGIDTALTDEALARTRALIDAHPGVVLFTSAQPDALDADVDWDLDGAVSVDKHLLTPTHTDVEDGE